MAKHNKFGTFGGVFVPSILTILGVIMYLRLPWIVGEAGLWAALGIIAVAHVISITTGLSVSSIATDKKVEAGGTYYMISRSLGLPIGGTLGIALFIGLSFSVSLYLIGFSESFLAYWGFSTDINNIRITGTIVLLAVTTLTFISTSLAVKTQYFIMAAIGLSLVSVFFGNHEYTPDVPLLTNPASTVTLMVLFGIFFPAVTGFEAGVSMSGDLKDPKKSIPLGSIMAILVGLVVYIVLVIFFSYSVDGEMLRSDPNVLLKIAWIPELVIAGIWGATLSSALGSILGAPRILQATATDRITHRFFAKGFGLTNEPRNALLATFVIAEAGILIGELNIIARVVSVFFITTYGFLNISAAFERWTSTDFRPEFKVPGWVSLIGALACLIVMIQLDFVALIGATVLMGLLFVTLKHRELSIDSGDAWSSVWASLVKTGITKLKKEKLHKRNWRPNIIMFSGNPETRQHIFEIGAAISGNLGILSGFELIEDPTQKGNRFQSVLRESKNDNNYFLNRITTNNIFTGMDEIARVHGFAGIEPNTILLGWSNDPDRKDRFISLLDNFEQYGFSTIALDYDETRGYGNHETIDIWWNGQDRNLSFALRLINHLTRSSLWKSAKKRLLIINPRSEDAPHIYRSTAAVMENFRETAEIKIINNDSNPKTEREIVTENSCDTDLVIFGISPQQFQQHSTRYNEIGMVLQKIGNALLITASSDFEEINVMPQNIQQSGDQQVEFTGELPPLPITPYLEIDTVVNLLDSSGQKAISDFHKKAIQPTMNVRQSILKILAAQMPIIREFFSDLKRKPGVADADILIEALRALVGENIRSIKQSHLSEKVTETVYADLQFALEDFNEALRLETLQTPLKLRILHPREEFHIGPDDTFKTSFSKRIKRIAHPFSKEAIPCTVRLRKEVRQHFYYESIVELNSILDSYKEDEKQFFEFFGHIINHITIVLDDLERKVARQTIEAEIPEDVLEIEQSLKTELAKLKTQSEGYEGSLMTGLRIQMRAMSETLKVAGVKPAAPFYYSSGAKLRNLVAGIMQFPVDHLPESKTLINMIALQLVISSTKNGTRNIIDEFEEALERNIRQKVTLPHNEICEGLKNGTAKRDLDQLQPDLGFEAELVDVYDLTKERIASLIQTLPESIEIYSAGHDADSEEEIQSIPVARMMGFYMKSRYEVTIEERFSALLEGIKQSIGRIKELITLTFFSFENAEKPHEEIVNETIKKVVLEKQHVEKLVSNFNLLSQTQFENVFDPMSAGKLEESASNFESGLRKYKGKQVLGTMSRITQKTRQFAISSFTKALYKRSEGILLPRRFRDSGELSSTNSRLLELSEKVSPNAQVMQALPPFYITLFSGKSSIGMDFWITRRMEEAAFRKAIERYRQGFTGGILVLADRNAGKTSFCRQITSENFNPQQIFSLFAPIQGTLTIEGFTQALSRATMKTGNIHQIFSQLPQNSVLIINDMELFWERTTDGQQIIELLSELIDNYGNKILFVVNMNPHTYKVINRISGFGSHFIENIILQPFDSEILRELILKRHRSSGLQIVLEKETSPLNELETARLFNGLFNYSSGFVGTALNGWLASINEANGETLSLSIPAYPPIMVLRELNVEWEMLLTQFVLHKRLTPERIGRISDWTPSQVKAVLTAMLRAGIIAEKTAGIYHIQPFIHPFVIEAFKEKEILS